MFCCKRLLEIISSKKKNRFGWFSAMWFRACTVRRVGCDNDSINLKKKSFTPRG